MRADAARNRQAVLDAARLLLARQGVDVTMETVARTAGVGVGTVYRHFPDRAALVRTVVSEMLTRVGATVEVAVVDVEGPDPLAACEALLAGVVGSGLPALLPQLLVQTRDAEVFAPEVVAARDALARRADGVVRRAQERGALRADLGTPEILLAVVSATRPLPGLPDDLQEVLVARRVAFVLGALRPGGPPLPGEPVPLDALLAAASPLR